MTTTPQKHIMIFAYLASSFSLVACMEDPVDSFEAEGALSPVLAGDIEAPTPGAVPATVPAPDADEPSCAEHLRYTAELSFHMLEAQCAGDLCSFDYDPPEQLITRVNGSYDQSTGDFSWTVSYVPEHWMASTTVSGNGTIDEDGDEVSSFVRTHTDIGGNQTVESVELDRDGCEMTTDTTRDGVTETLEGEFSDEFDYEAQRPPSRWGGDFQVDVNGVYVNGLIEEDVQIEPSPDDAPFWWGYQEGLYRGYDGLTYVDFYQWSPVVNRSRSGYCEINVAGDEMCEADIDLQGLEGFAAWWFDYAGNGGGINEFEWYDEEVQDWEADYCEVSFVDGVCSRICEFNPDTSCAEFLFN